MIGCEGDLQDVKNSIEQSQGTDQVDDKTLASALCISCDRDWIGIGEHLLETVSPKIRWGYGRTPLMYATSRAVAAALINKFDPTDKCQELDVFDDGGRTALMHARAKEVAELLIHEGASLDEAYKEGYSALMCTLLHERASLQQPCAENVELLISKGADINAADIYVRTILMTAVWKNRLPLVQRLIDMGVAVNKLDSRDRIILHHLCEDQKQAVRVSTPQLILDEKALIQMLLKAGVNVNEPEAIEHKTPLHLAVVAHNNIHINAILANSNVNCDVNEQRGRTALHIAAASG